MSNKNSETGADLYRNGERIVRLAASIYTIANDIQIAVVVPAGTATSTSGLAPVFMLGTQDTFKVVGGGDRNMHRLCRSTEQCELSCRDGKAVLRNQSAASDRRRRLLDGCG